MKQALIVGCGLSGSVIARELADKGYKVRILERRNHIGGNMYDHVDEYGILVHDYGPHTFHTNKKELFDYICRYGEWDDFKLTCGAVINGICTPTPFNFKTIDDFFSKEDAIKLKNSISKYFGIRNYATVVELLNCPEKEIKAYAQFLFDNDYSLYTAKQWGISPSEIDPSILKRVPIRFNYSVGYFDDAYQVMPRVSFVHFFDNLLSSNNISIELNVDALDVLSIKEDAIYLDGDKVDYPVIYTGPVDELFNVCYGELPYRSLEFKWVHEGIASKQDMPVVAYPQEKDFIRIIEYKKLPIQNVEGTTYEIEYSAPYVKGEKNEPYYPILTEYSQSLYMQYQERAESIKNLFVCGRLGDFKYYNMDQALEKALLISERIIKE